MHINDFDYELPEELIAQKPQKDRDKCRLMVLRRSDNSIEHRHFFDILEYLKEGDCLLLNDSKVIPARLYGIKEGTGARVEFLLIKRIEGDTWETMVRPGKRLKPGDSVLFSDEEGKKLRAEILDYGEDGTRIVKMEYDGILMERLEEIGSMPLPPYISRPSNDEDKDDYQTVYCHEEGSVAAPTAGLHFTTELLEKAREKGVKIAFVTLHVGIGTFRPVKCETIENHHMHFEEYSVSEETAEIVNQTILSGGRVISVGTTSTRTAESAACFNEKSGKYLLKAGSGSTDIFIYPGYEFKIIESLITNFHLPKSTLMMLVSALYDREHILKAYDEAVREEYRFFSYGDAMFIE
ncbi:S-adenosylmethionine tRNA ribosyltransferase [Eubacterium sulci ATCC 35585]|nr:S-adenosylmethionine tRNA ribosyltransferase [Eubacterium sulci ATCC 35585]EUC77833.1 S-adenosylmethionine:tRNA ribosyltransferase-isomerase [Eubacterium sulci ATCC 35585]